MARRTSPLPHSLPTPEQLAERDRQLAELVPGASSPPTSSSHHHLVFDLFLVAFLGPFLAAVLAAGAVNSVRLAAEVVTEGREVATRAAAVVHRVYDELGLDEHGDVALDEWVERTEHELIGPVLVDRLQEPDARPVLDGERYPRSFAFVQVLYRVVFDREADLGAAGWVIQLEEGRADRADIVLALCRSHEYVEGGR